MGWTIDFGFAAARSPSLAPRIADLDIRDLAIRTLREVQAKGQAEQLLHLEADAHAAGGYVLSSGDSANVRARGSYTAECQEIPARIDRPAVFGLDRGDLLARVTQRRNTA